MIAFRIFLASLIDQQSGRWRTCTPKHVDVGTGAPRVVTLCVRSNEKWHSGCLLRGLALNRIAMRQSRDVPSVWRLYAYLLMAKKLTDIHASEQTLVVIKKMRRVIDSAGLYACESVLDALRAAVSLQAGEFDLAIRFAAKALRTVQVRPGTVGVRLSLSVSAMACLGLNDLDRASSYLNDFHAEPTQYVLPDSKARAAFTEIALVAAGEGARAAADRIRSDWHLLGTESACFVEDPTRPAWLVTAARRAGDGALAERSLQAIDWLARNNWRIPVLETAARYARYAFVGEPAGPPSILDTDGRRARQTSATHRLLLPSPRARQPGAVASVNRTNPSRQAEEDRLSSLSQREKEIARLVGQGMTNRQVASQLGLSPHTVNFHMRSIFRKLSISTRAQLGYIIARLDPQRDQPAARKRQD